VIGISQVIGSAIAGCAASCGAVLIVAGASKLYRGTRGFDDMTAIRRALRMPQRRWRLFGLIAGSVECVAGAVVCSGAYPVLSGVSLAALGAVFCAVLAYVVFAHVPGSCGCIRWRAVTETGAEALTWRAIARSGIMFGVGVGPGFVAGTAVLVLLSMPVPVRTPVCRRPLWRKTRTTLRALASHSSFAAMADSAGPFGPIARYRRTGCTDEFWFTVPPGEGNQAVVFQVNRAAPGARLAVHVSLRDVPASGASWPTRTITVADVLPDVPRGTGGRDDPRSPKRLAPTAAGR
jgi:hypothetical protein